MFELNTSEKRILEEFILENKTKYYKALHVFCDDVFDLDKI